MASSRVSKHLYENINEVEGLVRMQCENEKFIWTQFYFESEEKEGNKNVNKITL